MHAQILALIEGLNIARRLHLSPLIVETDCQVIVQAIGNGSLDHSDVGYLLQDVQWGLQHVQAQLRFVRRTANSAAHALAHLALLEQSDSRLSRTPPPSVEEVINSDCNDP